MPLQTDNKRIAKNAILLYIRMAFNMVVSLYTSRIVLDVLGVNDFGIYNVVGGLVAMFSMLSGSMSTAIGRFMTFELGRGNMARLKSIFSTSVTIQLLLSAIIIILSETVGLWLLNTQLNIPQERMGAANWVFQCSVATLILGLISIPYNAAVISHEQMSITAAISIGESVLRLLFVILLRYIGADKLITYAICLAMLALLVRTTYGWYCSKNFEECHFRLSIDKQLLKDMFSFSGWHYFGSGTALLMGQGVNLLINIFFDVAFNAARGVATHIDSAVQQFVHSFTAALNPQITKNYAKGDVDGMLKLVYTGSKFSFFLMLAATLPILFEADFILGLWLKDVPNYAVLFARLTLANCLLSTISNPLITAMLATGNIRNYQIVVGGLGLLIFPLTWILYKLGLPVYTAYITQFVIFALQLAARLPMLSRMVKLDVKFFARNVLARDLMVVTTASVFPILIKLTTEDGTMKSLGVIAICLISTCISVLALGMDKKERRLIVEVKDRLAQKLRIRV